MTLDDSIPLVWRKSSRSGGGGAQCVEMACAPGNRVVRDSKNATGPNLTFSFHGFTAFLDDVKSGRHDLD
ncbi:DUF397 domain-containing protein [Umezawaea sp. Da 62-37]|uniref:DUF397 domain-containing protein n=1 Tax=Umezawaea sp. Da 62-37 TaxID=3075927 RepID=UPI0028F6D947|nr:DUF397 domain-containing protein [Umezawaea sp. Da 62-37]WNV90349.1 DUF397 domain-containing protein [Umezawaea sp. Da 62-37]